MPEAPANPIAPWESNKLVGIEPSLKCLLPEEGKGIQAFAAKLGWCGLIFLFSSLKSCS